MFRSANVPSEDGYVLQFLVTAAAFAVPVSLPAAVTGVGPGPAAFVVALLATSVVGAVPFLVVVGVVQVVCGEVRSQPVHVVVTGATGALTAAGLVAGVGVMLGGREGTAYAIGILWPWLAAAGAAAATGRLAVCFTVPS